MRKFLAVVLVICCFFAYSIPAYATGPNMNPNSPMENNPGLNYGGDFYHEEPQENPYKEEPQYQENTNNTTNQNSDSKSKNNQNSSSTSNTVSTPTTGTYTVYVYAKVTGDTSGLTLNNDGWYTIGSMEVSNIQDPTKYSPTNSYVKDTNYTNAVNSISNITNRKNTTLDPSKIDFSAYGLKAETGGAVDFVSSGTVWHLDGTIDVKKVGQIEVEYTDNKTGKVIKTETTDPYTEGIVVNTKDIITTPKGYDSATPAEESITIKGGETITLNVDCTPHVEKEKVDTTATKYVDKDGKEYDTVPDNYQIVATKTDISTSETDTQIITTTTTIYTVAPIETKTVYSYADPTIENAKVVESDTYSTIEGYNPTEGTPVSEIRTDENGLKTNYTIIPVVYTKITPAEDKDKATDTDTGDKPATDTDTGNTTPTDITPVIPSPTPSVDTDPQGNETEPTIEPEPESNNTDPVVEPDPTPASSSKEVVKEDTNSKTKITKSEPISKTVPKTADNSHLLFWTVLMIIAIAAMYMVYRQMKKNNYL